VDCGSTRAISAGVTEEVADLASAGPFGPSRAGADGGPHPSPAGDAEFVGLWLRLRGELLDDSGAGRRAYTFNYRCPLGSAAVYGVPCLWTGR
jgi:hypothetical protein